MDLYDADGNAVSIDVENVEEIATLKEASAKLEEANKKVEELGGDKDYQGLRQARQAAEDAQKESATEVERLAALLKEKGVEDEKGKPLTAEEIKNLAKEGTQEVLVEEINSKKDALVESASRGDDNRKKVIEAEYKTLFGETKAKTEVELKIRLGKVLAIVDQGNEMPNAKDPFSRINDGSGGGGPVVDPAKRDVQKSVGHLNSMGYKFKSDKFKDKA